MKLYFAVAVFVSVASFCHGVPVNKDLVNDEKLAQGKNIEYYTIKYMAFVNFSCTRWLFL